MTGTNIMLPEGQNNMNIFIIISTLIGGIAVLIIVVLVLIAVAYSVQAKGIQEVSSFA